MAILTDSEVREAISQGDIEIDPFDEERGLQPASYDMRLGKRAIISKSVSLDELKGKIQQEQVKEINVEKEESITIPGGAFALVTTLERIKLAGNYAGHIGMRTYYTRKGLAILSGLQIDPQWDGVLVLGIANLSPRALTLDYKDHLCTIEIHRLNRAANQDYSGLYVGEQKEGKIPSADKDYLRTIETMSVSDLTNALVDLSRNVGDLGKWVRGFWIGFAIVIVLGILAIVFR
jgi:deoxycytidine triphosphate deaminase